MCFLTFFFSYPPTTEIYTLSLHDALPIYRHPRARRAAARAALGELCREARVLAERQVAQSGARDRKSTRLNSSHTVISYAVFCLKKKTKNHSTTLPKRTQPSSTSTAIAIM